MNTQQEILDFLQENKTFLKDTYHLTDIALFGSFARNEQKSDSDVDILIELEEDTKNIYDLKSALKVYLSKAFNRSVDLARSKYLKTYAKDIILKDALFV